MRERGIFFNAEMVRAILDGRKTQTRRTMKVQPEPSKTRPGDHWFASKKLETMVHVSDLVPGRCAIADSHLFYLEHCCPFGHPGDRLWVRESYRLPESLDMYSPKQVADLSLDAGYKKPWSPIQLEADGVRTGKWTGFNTPPLIAKPGKLRPSIHMPRWASRITLEITGVRVERLEDISEEDAKAEGLIAEPCDHIRRSCEEIGCCGDTTRDEFKALWSSIYGEQSWQASPWVWVVEFKRVEVQP